MVYHTQGNSLKKNAKLLNSLVDNRKLFFIPISNTIKLNYVRQPRNQEINLICPSRITFTPDIHELEKNYQDINDTDENIKGTDILLRGLEKFISSGGICKLHLYKKGPDIEKAKKLISELNIKKFVIWHKETKLSTLYKTLETADIVCDNFYTAMPGMVTYDSYAIGRPVMTNLGKGNVFPDLTEPLPGFNAGTPEEIKKILFSVLNNNEILNEVGLKSRNYAEKYLSPQIVASKMISKLISLNNFTYNPGFDALFI
jgi:glycosyltransferase involved in cell wall biosynthesis